MLYFMLFSPHPTILPSSQITQKPEPLFLQKMGPLALNLAEKQYSPLINYPLFIKKKKYDNKNLISSLSSSNDS